MSTEIGSIFVDLKARTAGIDSGIKDATGKLKGFAGEIGPLNGAFDGFGKTVESTMVSVGARLIFGRSLVFGLAAEFKNVAKNIDSIPGIPGETIQDVHALTYEMSQAKGVVDRVIASFEGIAGKAAMGWAQIGDVFKEINKGTMVPQMGDALTNDMTQRIQDINNQWQKTPEYVRQVSEEQQKLSQAIKEGTTNTTDEIQKYQALMSEAMAFKRNAAAGALGELESLRQEVKAQQDLNEAGRITMALKKALTESEVKLDEAMDRTSAKTLSAAKQVALYESRIRAIQAQYASLQAQPQNANTLSQEKFTVDALTRSFDGLQQAQAKVKDGVDQMRQSFVSGFQSLSTQLTDVLTGTKANFRQWAADTVKEMLNEFLKLGLINPILNSVFASAKGYQAQTSLGGGGISTIGAGIGSMISGFLAGGGPAGQGQAYVVGEEGPELFVPQASGTVIPNSSLDDIGGGSTSNTQNINQTINIPAGVSHAELMAVIPKITAAAKSAVVEATRRGGPFASAFGTA